MDENKIVLCGANAYEKKYYFNEEQFKMIPESIKEELHIICVLFTEEVGGVFTIAFEEDGNVVMETNADDDDIYYDEVSSGLLIAEIRRSRQPGDEFYCHLPLHASRQSDHRPVAAEDRPKLPHGAVLADLFRRPRSAECLWVCCREKWQKTRKMRNSVRNKTDY